MLSGDLHTIPVGFDLEGVPRVVMDILLFDGLTAEQSIRFASAKVDMEPSRQWEMVFEAMEKTMVPLIRATCARRGIGFEDSAIRSAADALMVVTADAPGGSDRYRRVSVLCVAGGAEEQEHSKKRTMGTMMKGATPTREKGTV